MEKVLIIQRLGIGDVVLTTPLAQLIKEKTRAKVGFVVAPKAVDILKDHPYIDDIFSYRQPSQAKMLSAIRNSGYSKAILVDERLSSLILALRAGCKPLNAGFGVTIAGKALFKRKEQTTNAILDYLNYARLLGIEPPNTPIKPTVGRINAQERAKVEIWLAQIKTKNRKLVIIFPQGLTPNKNWPIAYFSELTKYLNKIGIIPVFFGSAKDALDIETIQGDKIIGAGSFNLRELAVIAEKSDLCISVCTGPMHIAATTNIPIVALYGPTSPERWAPATAHIVKSNLPCMPCKELSCNYYEPVACMRRLTPEMVLRVIKQGEWL